MVTTSGVPPCGIEGSGIYIQDCNAGGDQTPPPVTGLSMTTARAGHTATLLRDGKVLITGGTADSSEALSLASAELYDPSSGTFTPTGDMTTARTGHSATLLADGRVLLAGGVTDRLAGYTVLGSAEIYDPATGTFTATGNMISNGGFGPGSGIATLLPDGRVFIGAYGNAEIYDPSSGTFALTGPYSTPINGVEVETATLLPDGKVLVVGYTGSSATPPNPTIAELFDPKTDTFSPADPLQLSLPPPSSVHPNPWSATTLLLMDGTVLLVDGNEDELPDDVQVYDPASGTFTHIGYTHDSHEFATVMRLPDGRVLIAGGQMAGGGGSRATELYVPATGTLAAAATLTIGRHEHTATLLSDGTVLIAGGYSIWPHPTASAEIYK